MAAAYSGELARYGAPVYAGSKRGFKNYPAAYATGLLLARRLLSHEKIKLDQVYQGTIKVDGAYVKAVKRPEGERRRPFKVLLDVGLSRTTTGARLFAAMKGAVDGGLFVPHKPTRFPADKAMKGKFNPKQLRKYIFGKKEDFFKY